MQAAAKSNLCNLVEDELTSLIRDSTSVARHAKRSRFHHPPPTSNSNDGKNDGTSNQTTPASNSNAPHQRLLDAQDINLALQYRGQSKLLTTGAGAPFASSGNASQIVELNNYVRNEMQSRPPSEIGLALHWLAVDGIQPAIPSNPLVGENENDSLGGRVHPANLVEDIHNGSSATTTTTATRGGNFRGVNIRKLLPHLLSDELRLYFTRITLAIEAGGAAASEQQHQGNMKVHAQNWKQVQMALTSVRNDVGIQELVPFLVRFASSQIYENLDHARYCRTLVQLGNCMIENPNLHLELHLHQLIPAIITCVVARRISYKEGSDDHWSLREEAACTLVKACNVFGSQYETLKARILKTLCEAIHPKKPLATRFGGIVGITHFGCKAIDAFLLPIATLYWKNWEDFLEDDKSSTTMENGFGERRFEIQQCQQALLNALGIYIKDEDSIPRKSSKLLDEEFVRVFGERFVPAETAQTEYGSCFV